MRRAKHNPGISWFWLAAGFAGAYALYKMAQPEEAAAKPEPTPAGSSPEGASALTPSASAEPMPATPASPKAAESKEPKAQEPSRPPKLTRPSPRLGPGMPSRPKRQFRPSAQSAEAKPEVSAAETPRGAGALRKP